MTYDSQITNNHNNVSEFQILDKTKSIDTQLDIISEYRNGELKQLGLGLRRETMWK